MPTHTIGYRDKVVIPDKYNTGPRVSSFTDKTSMVYIGKNDPRSYTGCHFKGQLAVKFGSAYITDALYFTDCLFTNGGTYCLSASNPSLQLETNAIYFENCEFYGFNSACVSPQIRRMYFKNCKMHKSGGDGGKGFLHGGYENCYFYDIGRSDGAHADGIQTTAGLNGFYMKNCRMDVPSTSESVGNAGLFFIQEADATDVVVKDLMMNGGNYTFYIGTKGGIEPVPVLTNVTGENIKIGEAYTYGRFNSSAQFHDWITDGTVTNQDKLFVSSVYKDASGVIKVHVTNYTLSQRTLIMVSDEETITQTIPACYSSSEGKNHTFDEFPYDLEYEIHGIYVTCYDTSISAENQIRFQYCSVSELFGDIADAVRSKRGISDDIYRVDLPYEISQISSSATLGTKSITVNGTYNASSDNYDGYSSVTVNVPQEVVPTGTINITQNGDTDVTNYATAHVAVPEPSGSQTFTNNGTYNVSSIAEAVINVSSAMPSYLSIQEQALSEDSLTITFPYDSTKTVLGVHCHDTVYPDTQAYCTNYLGFIKMYNSETNNYQRVYQSNGSTSAQYGSIEFDSENGIITLTSRGGNYGFKKNKTYRIIIIYAETES